MQPQVATLASKTVNIFKQTEVVYYGAVGENLLCQRKAFEAYEATAVDAFVFDADTQLLIYCVNKWIAKTEYAIKNLYSHNKPLQDKLREAIGKIRTLRDKLKNYNNRPDLAGMCACSIGNILEEVKPPQDKMRSFMDYFRASTVVEQYSATYYKPIKY